VRNPATGERRTNAEVARLSAGELSEEEVKDFRDGSISNPSLDRVIVVADVFGVQPSFVVDHSKEKMLLDGELVEALRDETVRAIICESSSLTVRERRLVLGIVRQFRNQHARSSN
jgi:hypothetical protein